MHKVYLSLGGNIGDKAGNFSKAHKLVSKTLGSITKISSVYESPAWGFHSDDKFWNQVVLIETGHSPESLLENIHQIEDIYGRKRGNETYSSREMDIDILYYNSLILKTGSLIIPHPLIQQRKFVLVPLVEIAPDFVHPVLNLSNFELLDNCLDESLIKKVK